ncbi:MAG: hypothetical protein KG029_03705 [Bacteroidetes bacterium]|nr:hypothetical protein [Bacteroidota bacterium]
MITQSTYTAEITDYASLEESIRQLKVQKLDQEAMLKSELTALVNSVSPAKIVKDSLHNLVSDNGVQTDFVKMGLNLGVDLITARLFGRYHSIPVFLGMKVVEKVAGFLLKRRLSKSKAATIKLLTPGSVSMSEDENMIS